ncbi:S-adenosyl-L-methionine-dependent methyltransferase [Clavulina sp. PMI_390]|nr:S-adenosyl-L-methionine-dependent methyltransferase [Clavulina sp. PMI_390]
MSSAAASLTSNEAHKKVFLRAQEIMAQHDGGRDTTDVSKAINTEGWEQTWKEGATPWTWRRINAPIDMILSQNIDGFPRSGKALVPGCGKGDDVVLFAKAGYEALGIDASATAIKLAEEWLATLPKEDITGSTAVKNENYFTWAPAEGFDIIYDYTFFVAIPPVIREQWAESAKRLIKPGGVLATLVFPIDGDRLDGPPFSVDVETYRKVLNTEDWEVIFEGVPPNLQGQLVGRAKIVLWKSRKPVPSL